MNLYVIICSVNRPEVLNDTVKGILKQTKLPESILISVACEADVLTDTRDLANVDVRIAPVRGSSAQRNYGVDCLELNDNDLVVFLDDDVELSSHYLETMVKLFQRHSQAIGLSAETLIGGRMISREKAQECLHNSQPLPVEQLTIRNNGKHWTCHGCNMLFRAQLLKKERFDENLPLYSYAEDYDFSIRAARHGQVGKVAGVGFVHLSHSSGRVSEIRRGYSMVANNFYLLNKKVTHLPLFKAHIRFWLIIVCKETWVSFCRALSGRHADEIDYSGRVRGRLMAVGDIILRRCSPNEILNGKRFR